MTQINPNIDPIFRKIAESKASAGGARISDGRYLWAVQKMLCERKFGGTMFIVELVCKTSEATEPDPNAPGKLITPNAPGSTAGYVVNLDSNLSAAGNAKAFVLALFGIEESKVTPEDLAQSISQLCAAGQPARGMLIGDTTFRKPIQKGANAGKPFVGHRWTHIDQTAEMIAGERAAMDRAGAAVPAAV